MSPKHPFRADRRGFAVVEAVLSALIIGLMLAAAVETVGRSRASQAWSANRVKAYDLAAQLMSEITAQSYADPNLVTITRGPDGTEGITGRSAFNDVDDYHGLVESPPRLPDGTPIAGSAEWERSVVVQWLRSTLDLENATDAGIKRIVVTVRKNGVKLAELHSIRTSAVSR